MDDLLIGLDGTVDVVVRSLSEGDADWFVVWMSPDAKAVTGSSGQSHDRKPLKYGGGQNHPDGIAKVDLQENSGTDIIQLLPSHQHEGEVGCKGHGRHERSDDGENKSEDGEEVGGEEQGEEE